MNETKAFPDKIFIQVCVLIFFSLMNLAMLCVSVIMGYKLIHFNFFNITLSSGIFTFPLSYICLDIMTEIFGFKTTRPIIYITYFSLFIFSLFIKTLISIHSNGDFSAYTIALNGTFRLTIAVIFSVMFGDYLNSTLLSKWKITLKGRFYWLRSLSSTAIGEFCDTAIGFGIAFIGVLPFSEWSKLALYTFLVKIIWSIICVLPSSIIVLLLKDYLKLDVYDHDTNYNPLKIV